MSLILEGNGWTRDAIELTEKALEQQKNKHGEDYPDTFVVDAQRSDSVPRGRATIGGSAIVGGGETAEEQAR